MNYHHVLLATDAVDALERPVFIRLKPTDELPPPSTDLYRVYGAPIPLTADFCVVTPDNERFCTVGVEHVHIEEQLFDEAAFAEKMRRRKVGRSEGLG